VLFNSLTFLFFFSIVLALHRLAPTWPSRKAVLLVGSYLFYAAWNPPYVLILLFSTTLDWWLARFVDRSTDPRRRRALLILSLGANLGLLGFFKYGGFLLANTSRILAALGIAYQPPAWDIVLPVGISFYTFASLSYTIDVYRREIPARCSLLDYALFVSFFPHLVAGPIVRARLLLPQIEHPREISGDQVGWGLTLVCIGLFCKAVLADAIFAPVVDQVYAHPAMYGALDTWAAVLGFSGQIYLDFSGYSLCAIGLALCFGFEFPDNFRFPYAARGFSDFWRRWHISLSTWLRDYLYIPLGGNRRGPARTYLNLMLTMLIGGLWHGASWMFVLWGGLHGIYLAAERWARGRGKATTVPTIETPAYGLTVFTFLVVTLTWVPFRAPSMAAVGQIAAGLGRIATPSTLGTAPLLLSLLTTASMLVWQLVVRDSSLEEQFGRLGNVAQTAAISACMVGIFLCSGGDERAFIYFQF
jgi:alginate O-acetyltransferase complex protein AlgI